MTSFFRTLTPALAVIATLGLGAAHAQNTAPAAPNAAPAVTAKSGETTGASVQKKQTATSSRHKADGQAKAAKKSHEAVTTQNSKAPAQATSPAQAPKS
jgi:hypothetical protein